MVDTVSETTRLDWHRVYSMGVYEFFNIASYTKSKNERRIKQIEELKKKK